MLPPELIYQNSNFFESLLEHRFIFDLGRSLLLRETPEFLNVLKADVDMFGFDIVLGSGARVLHVQMKIRSNTLPSNPYDIQENLWLIEHAVVIWILYSSENLESISYSMVGCPMPSMDRYPIGKRTGFRAIKMQTAESYDTIDQLAQRLFPIRATNNPMDRSGESAAS
jgi:hypothetical protein